MDSVTTRIAKNTQQANANWLAGKARIMPKKHSLSKTTKKYKFIRK